MCLLIRRSEHVDWAQLAGPVNAHLASRAEVAAIPRKEFIAMMISVGNEFLYPAGHINYLTVRFSNRWIIGREIAWRVQVFQWDAYLPY